MKEDGSKFMLSAVTEKWVVLGDKYTEQNQEPSSKQDICPGNQNNYHKSRLKSYYMLVRR